LEGTFPRIADKFDRALVVDVAHWWAASAAAGHGLALFRWRQQQESSLPEKLRISQCCHGPSRSPRFEAKPGDTIIVRIDGELFDAAIESIPSSDQVIITRAAGVGPTHHTLPSSAIVALVLDD